MILCASKSDLLSIPGKLFMTAGIMTHKEAAIVAERRKYAAYWWDKRSKRLYGKEK